jgi:hypothetical protein
MPTQAQPNGTPGDKPEKTKLEREIEEILQRAERDNPLPPPTPIDSHRRKRAGDTPDREPFTFPDIGKTARHWLDTAPMLVAFMAAIMAMIVSDFSALLATLCATAAVVALFWPVAASMRGPQSEQKMWRGRPYDPPTEQPQSVTRVQEWLRKKGILK